ncbi:hypothetical protein ABG768_013323 [Culter alburnus]|uniref:non-specific serine/threonine protein kinase n=1 Tax=Culter alburnus TaxID=194366 RepID=A0AAW2B3W9_CULAL
MGQRSSRRVRSFTDSEQVYDPNPSSSTAEKHPHRPDEKPVVAEGDVLPNSRPKKKKKKKGGNFFKWLSFGGKKKSTKNKSSDQGEMKDQDIDMETSRRSTDDNICCRYAIGSKLGQGGFGAIYEGTRLADGKKVAVKFVKKTKHTECISIPDHPKPLPKEVALTILANKGPAMDIIKLLDWQDQQDFYIMVLERFSDSMDVSCFVESNGGSINEKFARFIMWGATLAADECCRRGVYHGDIKLENLLIDFDKLEVKLIDFGCGDLLTESAYTRFCGTMMYCPPEYRIKGEFHAKPATVWTLGILLFRMLCGHFPDTFDLYRINMNTWYKPGLTEDCCHLICSLLQQKPERRPDLERIVNHTWF